MPAPDAPESPGRAPAWEITPAELRRLRAALDRIAQRGGLDDALEALAGWALALLDASAVAIALRPGPTGELVIRAAAGRGAAAQVGRPLHDVGGDGSPGRHAWLRVPIQAGSAERGVAVARPRRAQRFGVGDAEILRLLATQAALALAQDETTRQNEVLYQRERRRAEQLQAVADLTRRVVRLGRLAEVLEFAASALKSRFGYDRVAVYLRDEEGRFALRASAGGGRMPAWLEPTAAEPAAWAAHSGEPQLVRAAPADERPLAELAVPIVLDARPVGVLSIASRDDGLDASDLALAESIADDLALAIENLRLAAQVRADAAAAERARVARELHDETAQQLVAIGRQLELLRARDGGGDGERVETIQTMVDDALGNVRRISRNLRPSMLDELGLVAALEALVADQARRGATEIRFRVIGRARTLAPTVELAFYRIAQEALGNAVRHAGARRIDVRLRFADPVVLEVADDGSGLSARGSIAELERGGGMGLIGMRDRAAEVGGRLEVVARPTGGTLIRVGVPVG